MKMWINNNDIHWILFSVTFLCLIYLMFLTFPFEVMKNLWNLHTINNLSLKCVLSNKYIHTLKKYMNTNIFQSLEHIFNMLFSIKRWLRGKLNWHYCSTYHKGYKYTNHYQQRNTTASYFLTAETNSKTKFINKELDLFNDKLCYCRD